VAKNQSFREESNRLGDLKDGERKALAELRAKVEEAILGGKLFDVEDSTTVTASTKVKVEKKKKEKKEGKKKKEKKAEEKKEEVAATEEKREEEEAKEAVAAATEEKKTEEEEAPAAEEKKAEEAKEEEKAEEKKEEAEAEEKKEEAATTEDAGAGEKTEAPAAVVVDKDVALWGVPLLPSKGDEATDVVLLKFLRARDFKAGAAFDMLRKTLLWRREWKSLAATAADDGADGSAMPEGACRLDGADREGHPVCYNALGVFTDDAVYKAALGDDEGKARFLRWRVRAMEEHVAKLDFAPGGVASLLQVTDLKNSPGPAKKDFRVAIRQVVDLFQDNYPELVARNVSSNPNQYDLFLIFPKFCTNLL
jgi:actin-related protein